MAPTHRPLIGFSMKQKTQLPINNKGAIQNVCWYFIPNDYSVLFSLILRVTSLCGTYVSASWSRHIFVIGLTKMLLLVWSLFKHLSWFTILRFFQVTSPLRECFQIFCIYDVWDLKPDLILLPLSLHGLFDDSFPDAMETPCRSSAQSDAHLHTCSPVPLFVFRMPGSILASLLKQVTRKTCATKQAYSTPSGCFSMSSTLEWNRLASVQVCIIWEAPPYIFRHRFEEIGPWVKHCGVLRPWSLLMSSLDISPNGVRRAR